jgi:hypothetical protein
MKRPITANDNLIELTRRLLAPRLGRDLSPDDAREAVANVTGFFALLAEWSHSEETVAANDNDLASNRRAGRAASSSERGDPDHG